MEDKGPETLDRTVGLFEISGSKSIFKFGVNGSGRTMPLGNADKIKLRN